MGKPKPKDPRLPRMDIERRLMLVAVERMLDSARRIRAAEKGRNLQ